MISLIKTYWIDRSAREQQLLTIMFVLLFATILWFGITVPIRNARIDAEERFDRASIASEQVLVRATALRAAVRAAPPPLGTSLIFAVRTATVEAGFSPSKLEQQDENHVIIAISSAKSPALFAWLAMLAKRGIFVERTTLRPNTDATLSFEATLRLRAS